MKTQQRRLKNSKEARSNISIGPAMIASGRNGPTPEEIATTAYYMYLDEGCPEGREMQHWAAAEAQLRSSASA